MAEPSPGILWALFSFRGRMGRKAFFWGSLLPVLAFVISVAALVDEIGLGEAAEVETTLGLIYSLIMVGTMPLGLFIYAAMGVKRLHDFDLSGFLILLAMVPFIALLAYLALCLIEGTSGPNRFGPRRNSRPDDPPA